MTRLGGLRRSLGELARTFRWPTKLEWRIARRYLRSRRGARTASLNTVISTGGVAVGVTALIVVLGVMNGLRNDLRERILVANPHLRVLTYGAGLRVDDWRQALAITRKRARRRRRRARSHQPGGNHRGPGLRRRSQPARVRPRHRQDGRHLAAAGHRQRRSHLQGDQAQRRRRHPSRHAAGGTSLRLSRGHHHPRSRHRGKE